MRYRFYLLLVGMLIFSCSHGKKQSDNADSPSVYKVWEFKKIDTLKAQPNNLGSVWIGRNQLDLTNKDTLRFSYQSNKKNPTAYSYKIGHDTIFVQNKAAYKIVKLSPNELDLVALFNEQQAFVMVYEAK